MKLALKIKKGGRKMNPYQAFTWWHLIVIVSVAIMVVMGKQQYRLVKRRRKLKIIKTYGDAARYVMVVILTVAFTIAFAKESGKAVSQLFDNAIKYGGSPVYTRVSFIVVIPVGIMIYAFLLSEISRITANLKLCSLREERSRKLREKKDNPWV